MVASKDLNDFKDFRDIKALKNLNALPSTLANASK